MDSSHIMQIDIFEAEPMPDEDNQVKKSHMDLSHLKQRNIFGADFMFNDFLRKDDICYLIKHTIAPLVKIEDFEEMYKSGGRPPISPKVLLLVLIMQYLEKLSDRAAVNNLRFRLDWKIALGLELEFAGIHSTTLVKFRDRLLENNKASYAFDKILEHLVEKGFIKKNSKQRIDSTKVIGKIRELGRLELFHETLRPFCTDAFEYASESPKPILELIEYYIEEIPIRGISDVQKKKQITEAGIAMKTFIDWSESETELKNLKSFKTMKKVFEQNFTVTDPNGPGGKPIMNKVATGKDHICSPHETEARYASKGGKGWAGYKAQIAESIPSKKDGDENFITFADAVDSTEYDGDIVHSYIDDQKDKDILPSEVYGDSHYNTENNIKEMSQKGVELKGPVRPASTKKKAKNEGFEIDSKKSEVTCPEGKKSEFHKEYSDGRSKTKFFENDCKNCARSEICEPKSVGKIIDYRPVNKLLESRRAIMETAEYKEDMHKRNGIEGTISGLVRGQGIRNCRYRGKQKTRLQIKFSATAANIRRLHRKMQNESKKAIRNAA